MAKSANRLFGVGALLVVVVLMGWLRSPSPAQQPDPVVRAYYEPAPPLASEGDHQNVQPQADSVLLLRNGEMLQGRIARTEDGYDVFVSGGEIHVKAVEVQCHCRNIEEAYSRKRSLVRIDNALDHFELSQWCLKAGLVQQAAGELSEGAALEPTHPLVPVIERRLKIASLPVPKSDGKVKSGSCGPTSQELDRMVRGMPPKTVEAFAQTIQPLLVNNCSAAACHGQAVSNGFHLFRTSTGAPPSRLLTQRNLFAALQWLDRANPEGSPLLAYPARPHGTASVPIFTDRQVLQYRQLREWCLRVTQSEGTVMQASYNEVSTPDRNSRSSSRPYRRPSREPNSDASTRETRSTTPGLLPWEAATVDLKDTAAPLSAANRTARRDGSGVTQSAADLPDAERFNRQFFPTGRPERKKDEGTESRDQGSGTRD